ncbi:MAG: alpha/beta fold hydrolase, partial [Planctomycetales bacterium]
CFQSRYMIRVAAKLNDAGFRTFRMDLRGCGAGLRLSKLPFHSGRSADVEITVQQLARLCPGSPLQLVGFSMGGNIALKLLGELGNRPCGNLVAAIAVCPPIDLSTTIAAVENPRNRIYHRFILKTLWRQHLWRCRLTPDVKTVQFDRRPRGIRELDEVFTAPVCGFSSAAEYYRLSSSLPLLANIQRPAKIMVAMDDPVVPYPQFLVADYPAAVQFQATRHGGHLGFVGTSGFDPDRRWMEWRVVDWVNGGFANPAPQ